MRANIADASAKAFARLIAMIDAMPKKVARPRMEPNTKAMITITMMMTKTKSTMTTMITMMINAPTMVSVV